MKKIIAPLLIVLSLNLILSCNKEVEKNIDDNEEFIEQIYSEVLIENQDYDFGLISVNDTVSYTFKVKNISNEPLIITKVISNCDCVEIDYGKKQLMKNQELDILTKFIATKDRLGSVNNLMLIECNVQKGVEVLSMSGFVSE